MNFSNGTLASANGTVFFAMNGTTNSTSFISFQRSVFWTIFQYVSYAQFLTLPFHAVAMYIFVGVARRVFRSTSGEMSLVLKAFIVLWIIENLLSFPHTLHIIAGKLPGVRDAVGWGPLMEWHFWTVIWERSFSCSIPVAVFFLTIDRSLALLLGLHYKPIHKIIICVLCLLLVAFATAVTLYIYIDGHRPWPTFPSTNGTSFGNGTLPGTNGTLPGTNGTLFGANGTINGTFFGGSGTTNSTLVGGNGTTNGTNFSNYSLPACRATVCFLAKPDDWQFLVRVTFGTLNFACSLNFFYLLRKQNAKMFMYTYKSTAKNSGNSFVLYAVVSELLLNFIPHSGCLLFEMIFQTNISNMFGSISRILTSVDALACALMYRRM